MFSAALTVIREIIDVYQKRQKKGRKTLKKIEKLWQEGKWTFTRHVLMMGASHEAEYSLSRNNESIH